MAVIKTSFEKSISVTNLEILINSYAWVLLKILRISKNEKHFVTFQKIYKRAHKVYKYIKGG